MRLQKCREHRAVVSRSACTNHVVDSSRVLACLFSLLGCGGVMKYEQRRPCWPCMCPPGFADNKVAMCSGMRPDDQGQHKSTLFCRCYVALHSGVLTAPAGLFAMGCRVRVAGLAGMAWAAFGFASAVVRCEDGAQLSAPSSRRVARACPVSWVVDGSKTFAS